MRRANVSVRLACAIGMLLGAACGGATPVATSAAPATATVLATPTVSPTPAPPASIVSAGKVRVAYRVQGVLIKKDAAGTLVGVQPDIAAELAKRLGVKAEAIEYPTTDAVLAAAKAGAWDVTFDTIDTTKTDLEFTAPFIDIPLSYMVPSGSKIVNIADVDQAGVRIALLKGDTVDRYLTANIKNATLQRYDTDKLRNDAFANGEADVLPGSLTSLIPQSQTLAGARILAGSFLLNRWAIAVPKGNAEVLRYMNAFVADIKASGLVKSEIDLQKLVGVQVATN